MTELTKIDRNPELALFIKAKFGLTAGAQGGNIRTCLASDQPYLNAVNRQSLSAVRPGADENTN